MVSIVDVVLPFSLILICLSYISPVESVIQTPPRRTSQRDSKSRVKVPEAGCLTSSEDSPFSTVSITPPHEPGTTYGDLSVEARKIATHGAVCAPRQHRWTPSPVLSTPSLSSSPYSPYVPSPTSLASSSPDSSFTVFTSFAIASPLQGYGAQSTARANLGHALPPSQHGQMAPPYIDSSYAIQPCTSHHIPQTSPADYDSPSISSPFGATTSMPVQQSTAQHELSLSASTVHFKKTAARIIQVDAAYIPLVPDSLECPVQGCGFYQRNANRRPDLRKHVDLHTRDYNSARHGPKWVCRGITVEEAVQRGEDISQAKPWGDVWRVGGCGTEFSSKYNYQRHMNSKSCLRSIIPSA